MKSCTFKSNVVVNAVKGKPSHRQNSPLSGVTAFQAFEIQAVNFIPFLLNNLSTLDWLSWHFLFFFFFFSPKLYTQAVLPNSSIWLGCANCAGQSITDWIPADHFFIKQFLHGLGLCFWFIVLLKKEIGFSQGIFFEGSNSYSYGNSPVSWQFITRNGNFHKALLPLNKNRLKRELFLAIWV